MLRNCIVILFVIANGALSYEKPYYDLEKAEEYFADFIQKYDKHYKDKEEYNKRFETFKKKLGVINHLNEIHEATFDVNTFSDQEKARTGHIRSGKQKLTLRSINKKWIKDAPKRLDYRTLGLVTEVKNQDPCENCYIFGAVGNIEGQFAKLTGNLVPLSEQQALDCAGQPCNEGGDEYEVINFLSKQDGLMSESDYPYLGKQGRCHPDKNKVKVKVISGENYNLRNEEELKGALAKLGPLAIALHVSESIWQYRGTNVLKPRDCMPNAEPNHTVLLVGYSTDKNGTPYWIIKNSWGKDYGDNGYLYLEMGKKHCAILKDGATNSKVARP